MIPNYIFMFNHDLNEENIKNIQADWEKSYRINFDCPYCNEEINEYNLDDIGIDLNSHLDEIINCPFCDFPIKARLFAKYS